jgi:arylsulfatase A-like enzyme
MNRFLLSTICIVLLLTFGPHFTKVNAQKNRPNIIFILTDDQRFDMMGCAGNNIIQTPNMDALAAAGTRFTHAIVTTPICAASRASIITGLYERTHGYTFNEPPLKKSYTFNSYPYLLKQAGYQTGFVGKFGVNLETSIDSLFSWKRINGFPYWKTINGQTKHLTDIQADQAIEFIQQAGSEKPFCLSLSFSAPHADDDAKSQYFWNESLDTMYSNNTMPIPSTANPAFYESLPDFLKGTMSRERWFWRFDTPEKYQQMVKGYYRMISQVDMAIGRIRKELKAMGIEKNTVIIFMGDNGYFLGDRGAADKWLMHELSIRVPLIVFDPRNVPNKEKLIDNMVLNIDVSPTIMELAGLNPPKKLQGESLIKMLSGKSVKPRKAIFCEHLMKEPRIPNSEGIRTSQWKFIRYPTHPEFIELYDLQKDPFEEHNLAGLPSSKNIIKKFQNQSNQKIKELISAREK